MIDQKSLDAFLAAAKKLEAGFAHLPQFDTSATQSGRIPEILNLTAEKLHDTYPYFHPLYIGQMLKPPHPVARLAYALTMWINPNNHAMEGGKATSPLEKEAVAEIAAMFGWSEFLGHLCGGGTMANLEALWVAGQLNPGKKVVASAQSHYTHKRISAVLQLGFASVPCDAYGRMDIAALEEIVRHGDVGTVVATMGTTATGAVDPLPEILALSEKYNFRVHADCAYGGYFVLAQNLEPHTAKSLAHIGQADSIVIDPHKHGLQPYGCGCVLLRDPALGRLYKHDSPYTYFSSTELHLGEISLECSRPGAAAAALWATQKLLPLIREGEFSKDLERSRAAAKKLFAKVDGDSRFVTAFPPELDLVIFAPRAASVSEASAISRKLFDTAAKQNLYLAVVELPTAFFKPHLADMTADRETIACVRTTLMKPEHLDWLDRIWQRFELAYADAIQT